MMLWTTSITTDVDNNDYDDDDIDNTNDTKEGVFNIDEGIAEFFNMFLILELFMLIVIIVLIVGYLLLLLVG